MGRSVVSFDCPTCGQHNEHRPILLSSDGGFTFASDLLVPVSTCGWCKEPAMSNVRMLWEEL